MVLSANSDTVKRLVGEELGVGALTDIVLKVAGVGRDPSKWNIPVLKAALGALAVLSSDERNLATMRAEGMEQAVEMYGRAKDDKMQAFVRQLTERLLAASE